MWSNYYLPTYPPTHLLTYLPTNLPTYLPVISETTIFYTQITKFCDILECGHKIKLHVQIFLTAHKLKSFWNNKIQNYKHKILFCLKWSPVLNQSYQQAVMLLAMTSMSTQQLNITVRWVTFCVERLHMSALCRESGLGRHQGVNVSFQQDMEAELVNDANSQEYSSVKTTTIGNNTNDNVNSNKKKMCLFIIIYTNVTIFAVLTKKYSHNVPVSIIMPFCLSVCLSTLKPPIFMQFYIREFYTNTANLALLHSRMWYYAVFLTM